MENLSLIAAIGKKRELGLDNHLLWHIPEDLGFYKKTTWGKNIIVGKNTLESMPLKALEGRTFFVLSDRPLDEKYDVNVFDNINELVKYVEEHDEQFIVAGGASIYKQFLPYVDTMYLTEIKKSFKADTFFPEFNKREWHKELIDDYSTEELPYIRNKYTRKKVK